MNVPKKSKNSPKHNPEESEEIHIPDRHFRHNEPESDYSMDELDQGDDGNHDDPDFNELRQEQDDDE